MKENILIKNIDLLFILIIYFLLHIFACIFLIIIFEMY